MDALWPIVFATLFTTTPDAIAYLMGSEYYKKEGTQYNYIHHKASHPTIITFSSTATMQRIIYYLSFVLIVLHTICVSQCVPAGTGSDGGLEKEIKTDTNTTNTTKLNVKIFVLVQDFVMFFVGGGAFRKDSASEAC